MLYSPKYGVSGNAKPNSKAKQRFVQVFLFKSRHVLYIAHVSLPNDSRARGGLRVTTTRCCMGHPCRRNMSEAQRGRTMAGKL